MNAGTHRSPQGFSLIELMISLALGLLVILGATTVFLSNKQSYRSSEALSRLQEGSRIAFELLSRDVRQAALTGCGNTGRVANVLKNSSTAWWANWGNAVIGYGGSNADSNPAITTGTASSQHVTGTDSVTLIGASETAYSISSSPYADGTTTHPFTISETTTDIQAGDVIIVCDPDHAAIAQITSASSGSFLTGTSGATPANCTQDLSYPTDCTSTSTYGFLRSMQLAELNAASWYLGINPQGSRSLYRMTLSNGAPAAQEMVRNVTGFQLRYHIIGGTGFVDAASVSAANWANVNAVQITLTLQATDTRSGTNSQPLTRQTVTTIALRNRNN